MSVVSGSNSSSSGFEIEPVDDEDEVVSLNAERVEDARKLNSLKRLKAEQDPGVAVTDIANLDQESAKRLYFGMDLSNCVALEFDSDKTYHFNDKNPFLRALTE
eukprot:2326866-Prymnesium_polylepis.1